MLEEGKDKRMWIAKEKEGAILGKKNYCNKVRKRNKVRKVIIIKEINRKLMAN